MGYEPNPWMMLPFVGLLALIALAPLLFADWWGRHYSKVAFALTAITLGYYLFVLPAPAPTTVLHTAHEYASFIALIGSLFVVSGGIHIQVKGEATPFNNVVFLAIGAVLANLLGTTGASMLLIRPWLRMNKYRITAHHVVFFIFIVSNVGGCLTPIGDPPLFLGYLKGIPFWWVAEHCWPMWIVGVGLLLAIFYGLDRRNYARAPRPVRSALTEPHEQWRCDGLANLLFLAVILVAVFIENPPFVREALMLAAAAGSYFSTSKPIHEANHFNFHPIQEVAILFIGIFATMMPALDWLQLHAGGLDKATPGFFYWGSGVLSSVLDNAPTYLSFLKAIFGAFIQPDTIQAVQHLVQNGGADLAQQTDAVQQTFLTLQKYHACHLAAGTVGAEEIEVAFLLGHAAFNQYILAISIGAVFFGANTYIGNGPNFMVKSIADHAKVHTPGFLGYVFQFALPFLLPVLLVVWLLFFFSSASPGLLLGRIHGSPTARWDHEPGRTAFPGCRFGGLSSPPAQLGAGKPPEPAGRNACPTGLRFMGRTPFLSPQAPLRDAKFVVAPKLLAGKQDREANEEKRAPAHGKPNHLSPPSVSWGNDGMGPAASEPPPSAVLSWNWTSQTLAQRKRPKTRGRQLLRRARRAARPLAHRLRMVLLSALLALTAWTAHAQTATNPPAPAPEPNLPLVRFEAKEPLSHDRKVPCTVQLTCPQGQTGCPTNTLPGLAHIHGASSQGFPKKSFAFALEDPASLLGMRTSAHWILNAAYIDRSLMRHKLSYDLYRALSTNGAPRCAVASRFVEVQYNGRSNGVYLLMERMDRQLFGFHSFNSNDLAHACIYKAVDHAANFSGPGHGGFDQREPDAETRPYWKPLDELNRFVSSAPREDFFHPQTGIASRLDLDNAIDFHLLVLLTCNTDGITKNYIVARDAQAPGAPAPRFVFAPWDYDGTFGRNWDGGRLPPTIWLSNHLFDRLLGDEAYRKKFTARWNYLREHQFSVPAIHARIDENAQTLGDAVRRNTARWSGRGLSFEEDVAQMKSWTVARIQWLDQQINQQLDHHHR